MASFTKLCVLTAFLAAPLASADTLEAKKDGVKVIAEPKKGAEVKATLKKGEALFSSKRQGMFWEVKTSGGATGYVSVMEVSRKAESNKTSLSEALRAAAKDGRGGKGEVEATRSRSAVMGIRGLKEGSDAAFAGNVKANLRAVYAMEDFSVSEEQVNVIGNLVQREIAKRMEHQDAATEDEQEE